MMTEDKTLKDIRNRYKEMFNQRQLVEDLDEFSISNELYRDVPIVKSTLGKLSEEDLHLIAYEVFG